jgi:hypothetical protein
VSGLFCLPLYDEIWDGGMGMAMGADGGITLGLWLLLLCIRR